MTVLPNWLAQRAAISPERLALVADDARLSFAQLETRAGATAAWLGGMRVGPGDRVALLARNGAAFVEVVHALMRLGAVLVPINARLTADEIGWQLGDARVSLLLHDGAHAEVARTAAGGEVRTIDVASAEIRASRSAEPIDLDAVHCAIYTSGTTGRPKGALLTYGNHWWSAIGSALNLGHHEDDRWLAPLPLFHVGGLAILVRSVVYGIPAVVQRGFDAAAVNRAIDEERVTIVSVVAAMLRRMLDERGSRRYPAHLRCVLLGGGPAPRPLLEECAERGIPVVQTYGLSETASQVATLAPGDALPKLGSAGKPLMPTELRVDAPSGGIGEILVRGPTVSPGYLNHPPRPEGEWLRTGDLGRLDDGGYLYVVDRADDMFVSGGENVYPAEVEAALLAHPAVEEAGVVGVPDERWGEVGAAFVKLRRPVGDEELLGFCRARLAGYKVPRTVRFLETLPRNAAGKLLRRELRLL